VMITVPTVAVFLVESSSTQRMGGRVLPSGALRPAECRPAT
jgi:hypothetical protein